MIFPSILMRLNASRTTFSYNKKLLDHYQNPRNVGSLKETKSTGIGLVGSPACGDIMKLSLEIDRNNKIVDAKFKTFGCGSAIASSSYVTEQLIGKTIQEARQIKNSDISKYLNLPPVKLHCSMLAEDSITAALMNYEEKRGL